MFILSAPIHDILMEFIIPLYEVLSQPEVDHLQGRNMAFENIEKLLISKILYALVACG